MRASVETLHGFKGSTRMGGSCSVNKFTTADLRKRIIESSIRLRFYSPIIGASIIFKDLGFGYTILGHRRVSFSMTRREWTMRPFMQTKSLEAIPWNGSGIDAGSTVQGGGGKAALYIHSNPSHLGGPGGYWT